MNRLRINYAGCDYFDRTHSLIDGSVRPDGIDLNYLVQSLHDMFRRMAQFEEFDASEMSLGTLLTLISRGDQRFVAIPVFPSKNFRHSYIFVNTGAGIERPEDLKGKKIGVPEYQMTAALWIRAFLQHDYGVRPGDMRWYTGGLDIPDYVERSKFTPPADVSLEIIPEHRTLEEMLDAGDLDALISPVRPHSLVVSEGKVRRLFPNYREVEKDYYRRTGIFPPMHTVVIRRPIYEANPWVAQSLFAAFEVAKTAGRARLFSTGALAIGLPWVPADLEEIDEVFGGDPWVYGVEPNRKALEALFQYAYEQGQAARQVTLDEVFAKETFVPPVIGQVA
jgi:4,5-dihydroxyphthalate decarboxylase